MYNPEGILCLTTWPVDAKIQIRNSLTKGEGQVATYKVVASVHMPDEDGWQRSRNAPTFILDSHIQGIVTAGHAAGIARDVVDPFEVYTVNITVTNDDNYNDWGHFKFEPKDRK
jgi:hypothetical protein